MYKKKLQIFLILLISLTLTSTMLVFGMHDVTDDDVSVFLRVPPCSVKGIPGVHKDPHEWLKDRVMQDTCPSCLSEKAINDLQALMCERPTIPGTQKPGYISKREPPIITKMVAHVRTKMREKKLDVISDNLELKDIMKCWYEDIPPAFSVWLRVNENLRQKEKMYERWEAAGFDAFAPPSRMTKEDMETMSHRMDGVQERLDEATCLERAAKNNCQSLIRACCGPQRDPFPFPKTTQEDVQNFIDMVLPALIAPYMHRKAVPLKKP